MDEKFFTATFSHYCSGFDGAGRNCVLCDRRGIPPGLSLAFPMVTPLESGENRAELARTLP